MGKRETSVGAAYTADRAAGLAGVPVSTLHYWSRSGIWVPSVSTSKVKRWSYSDLLALRLIDWLRKDKPDAKLPKTSMVKIRAALSAVESLGDGLSDQTVMVWVEPQGGLVIEAADQVFVPIGKGLAQLLAHEDGLNLVSAWQRTGEMVGPDLYRPRPTLRIIPGKLSGEPHIAETRIPTLSVASLVGNGLGIDRILELYPRITSRNVEEAFDLETQLQRNLQAVA